MNCEDPTLRRFPYMLYSDKLSSCAAVQVDLCRADGLLHVCAVEHHDLDCVLLVVGDEAQLLMPLRGWHGSHVCHSFELAACYRHNWGCQWLVIVIRETLSFHYDEGQERSVGHFLRPPLHRYGPAWLHTCSALDGWQQVSLDVFVNDERFLAGRVVPPHRRDV